MAVIFQPSDLNQHGRAILDAAREGSARIRDKDGTALLVVPAERVESLETAARYAAEFLALERAAPLSEISGQDAIRVSPWPWLANLDADDLAQFMIELREALLVAFKSGVVKPIEQILAEWRSTAEQLADPTRRRVLLEPLNVNDFVEGVPPRELSSEGESPSDIDDSGSGSEA